MRAVIWSPPVYRLWPHGLCQNACVFLRPSTILCPHCLVIRHLPYHASIPMQNILINMMLSWHGHDGALDMMLKFREGLQSSEAVAKLIYAFFSLCHCFVLGHEGGNCSASLHPPDVRELTRGSCSVLFSSDFQIFRCVSRRPNSFRAPPPPPAAARAPRSTPTLRNKRVSLPTKQGWR